MNEHSFKTITLLPDEVLVLKTQKVLDKSDVKRIKKAMKKRFPNNKTVILDNETDIIAKIKQESEEKTEMTEFQKELLKKIKVNSIDIEESNTLLVTITVPCTNTELGKVNSSLKAIFPKKEIVVMACVQMEAHEG